MAEWQNAELSGIEEIAYVIAAHENADGDPPDAQDLVDWTEVIGFDADALVIDGGQNLFDAFRGGNPDVNITASVSVIIDKQMRIRKVGGTYDANDTAELDLLLSLSEE